MLSTISSTVKIEGNIPIIVLPGGKLIINGGTLTNAVCGILSQDINGGNTPIGRIIASDAHFINNQTSVAFGNVSDAINYSVDVSDAINCSVDVSDAINCVATFIS